MKKTYLIHYTQYKLADTPSGVVSMERFEFVYADSTEQARQEFVRMQNHNSNYDYELNNIYIQAK